MSAAKDIRIVFKTLFDRAGASRFGQFLKAHKAELAQLAAAYRLVKNAASGAFSIARKLTRSAAVATAAATAALGASVREAVKYNQQMARAWTMMGGGIETFRKMRGEVRQMSIEFGMAKAELADGLYNALSAGVPEDNVISFLRTAAKAAVGDGSDIATAIDGITTVLNAFGMSTTEATRVTDLLAAATADGKTNIREMSSYLAQAAPTASALGVSIEQVLGAVTAMTKQGTPTSQALNQIRNMMLSLNSVMGDGWAQTMTLQEALQKVYEQTQGSGTALEKIFGKENVTAVLSLTGDKAEAAAQSLAQMSKSAGAAERAFGRMMMFRNWNRLGQGIKAIVEQAGQVADSALGPIADQFASMISDLAKSETWEAWEAKAKEIGDRVAGLMELARSGDLDAAAALKDVGELLQLYLTLGGQQAANAIADVVLQIPDLIREGSKRTMMGRGAITARDFGKAINPFQWQMDMLRGRNTFRDIAASQSELTRIQMGQQKGTLFDPAETRGRIEAKQLEIDKRIAAATAAARANAADLKAATADSLEAQNQLIAAAAEAARSNAAATRKTEQQLRNSRTRQ